MSQSNCILKTTLLSIFLSVTINAVEIDTVFIDSNPGKLELIISDAGTIIFTNQQFCISKSTDYGETWINAEFDSLYGCFDISFNQSNPSIGFSVGGKTLLKTTNGGENWFDTGMLEYLYTVDVNPYYPEIIFAIGTPDQALGPYHFYSSSDGGNTWKDTTLERAFINPCSGNGDSNLVYAHHGNAVIKSTNMGESWANIIYRSEEFFTAIQLSSTNDLLLYAGTHGKIYRTTDGGTSWEIFGSALGELDSETYVAGFLLDESNPERIFVGLQKHGSSNGGLYLTEDEGETWMEIYDSSIQQIKADNENPRNVYCVTDFGLIRFTDTIHVTGINQNPDNLPAEYSLEQNYPNPFNPGTVINYNLPVKSNVKLKVYDILGREMITLVNTVQESGKHSVQFSIENTNLTSGVSELLTP
ncbi:MAG: T9SS type A sorting domain-containing protein [Melioribacteraceae bacterium]|nr:T9SS type A sorting domain-containing protein [Melioribacteraceae bacterium]MCF8356301.1 T9SS type A sorting domain-containing protein [Melioribacteraceae bacterium]MCF8393542.1 T9SS type A sorting domain-containing protein [Melioribacteraceae bacterium]MCF8419352.1 T9SS type A sorting domain-containing protein [Melioribacteraceae bacterium]